MKRKITALAVVVALLVLLTACGFGTQDGLALTNMEFNLADATGMQAHHFRLGTVDLTAANLNIIPGPVDGSIAVPNRTGPHPLVVLIHGASRMAHANIHTHVHTGFDYLIKQLAAEGYVALSINVNANYAFAIGEPLSQDGFALETFDAHMDYLARANAGESVGHGVELTNMVDFTQIHLIGHSRGGEIAETLIRREPERFASILRVAPVISPRLFAPDDEQFNPNDPYAQIPQPDVPFAILLPEYDGDVSSLEGQIVFDEIVAAAQQQSMGNVVFLRGANHNFFNRTFENDDRYQGSFADPQDQSTWLSRAEHEDFLKHYAAAFLAVVTGQRESWGTFNPDEPQPTTLFGFAATASTYFPGMQQLIAEPTHDAAMNAIGSATAAFHQQSFPTQSIGHGLFYHPGVLGRADPRLPLYALSWGDHNGAVEFPLLLSNLSASNAISLFVAVDSSDERNTRRGKQSFSVALTDSSGAEQSVVIPRGTRALDVHPGQQDYIEDFGDIWLGFTPLGELRIPLHYFDEIDLSTVTQLNIHFDQTRSGAIMLAGAWLV
ncbi:MAG: hypothetical protein FWE40_02670 [Oscillospiraceae bacterium]|nr:hypothetical protein [Oscillospiraceae bacterium]